MRSAPANYDDVIDSRDIIERIEEIRKELTSEMEPTAVHALFKELFTLEALEKEASGSPDWTHGEALIRDSYFEAYARELAEDCDMIPNGLSWPCRCIDWEQAAEELQMDYFSVDFDGVDYWIRA